MEIVNRGFIIVEPKAPFFEWTTQFELDLYFDENDGVEPTVYLIQEDFVDDELVVEQNFKKIFKSELSAITEDETDWPKISFDLFKEWFSYRLGSMVMDLEKGKLEREEI